MTEPTISAFAAYDGIGVCTHMNWPPYRNYKWQPLIADLGVRHTRGTLGHQATDVPFFRPVRDLGVKHCAPIVESTGFDLNRSAAEANLNFFANNLSDFVIAVEGPNEYNNGIAPEEVAKYAASLRDFMVWMHGKVRANPKLANVKIVAPSIWHRELAFYKAVGNIEAYVDRGCLHYYTDKKPPTQSNTTMDVAITNTRILTPTKPIDTTETGYSNHVTPKVKAKYTLRVLLELLSRGVERAYNYELFDTKADPLWGLCDAALNKRPAYFALKNLLALLADAPSAPVAFPGQIGTADKLHKLALSRSDGRFDLCLWRDLVSTEADSAAANVAITLPKVPNKVELFEPTFTGAVRTIAPASQISIPVRDQVAIARIAF